ncbi:dTDP-4-dehydrorhamnose reductase [Paracandidimonas lactea]|uniref:dTDP-4-dehydrorhamnose reductase n=1 Tax=Paracandidimonas lactea TaxID=2895524 RepID=UPI001F38EEC4|nr:dTDP-4-dehydrorhamnose reductase [Paracandidimonas lactea]
MKILLFGSQGQLGWALQRSLAPLGELVALHRRSTAYCGDLTQPDALRDTVRKLAPHIIVNAAAYTAVDQAEGQPDVAHAVNATAPGILAEEAKRLDAWLVHYSTDYVFNGEGSTAWREADRPAPLNVYGQSKLQGEQAIQAVGCKHLILRSSWLFSARGKNFATTILRLARECGNLTIVDDQIGAPTSTDLLADVTSHAITHLQQHPDHGGIYHVAAAGETSWYGYARYLLQHAHTKGPPTNAGPDAICPVHSAGYPTRARRPHNSRLDTSLFTDTFGLYLPRWQTGVERLVDELACYD